MEEYTFGTVDDLNLEETTIETFYAVATLNNCTPEDAIDRIVKEWVGMKEFRRLRRPSEESYLDQLAGKADSVDKLVDEVILKLERAKS